MLVGVIHDLTNWAVNVTDWSDAIHGIYWHLSHDSTVLAQQFNTDVFADFRKSVDHFIKTGQVWALLIGVILGYLIKGFTSYG